MYTNTKRVGPTLRGGPCRVTECRGYSAPRRRLIVLLGDERGTISILSVFAVMLLVMLLGMVMNSGRQVDGKIRMQNAADGAAYSGGVVLARGMNMLAFTNHMLCDAFALTAFLREGRDRNAEKKVPPILDAWKVAGKALAGASFSDPGVRGFPPLSQKIPAAGNAILAKVPHEQELVRTYSEWAAAASEKLLPLLEEILQQRMIPEYQRALVTAIPDVAQRAPLEVARRNGNPQFARGPMLAVLWKTSGTPVSGGGGMSDRVLPVVDPVLDAGPGSEYTETARKQREQRARQYLNQLNTQAMWVFDHPAQFSQFNALWRGYTCGQMMKLLDEEYPYDNLPHVIRTAERDVANATAHMDEQFTFIAVAYAKQVPEILPGVATTPIDGDATAFAEIRMFVPWRRLQYWPTYEGGTSSPSPFEPPGGTSGTIIGWHVGRQEARTLQDTASPPLPDQRNAWDLFNQSWAVQLVPATHDNLVTILQTPPPASELSGIDLPSLGGLTTRDIRRISMH
jgi:hypothetical protein